MLRSLGCSQDATGSTLGYRNKNIKDVEQWYKTCTPDEAISFCDDQAINRLVEREFARNREISPDLLDRACQLTADDILRHYRQDYLHIRHWPKEEKRILSLIKLWREQLQFQSVDQLLREYYFENRYVQLEREATETEEVKQMYLKVQKLHWEKIPRPYKVALPV